MFNAIISTQVKDENPYLDEWVCYHLGIGFEHIVIYDNESSIPVKNIWGKKVTVIKEHRQFEGSTSDNCHNDTIRNFDANWIARIDIDEFIALKKHKDINELLEPYKCFGGLGINWRIFGTSGHKIKPNGLVKDNYVWRMPDNCGWILNGGSSQLKTIIRREFCIKIHHPHFCMSSRPLVNEDLVPYLDAWTDSTRTKAVIHHYVTKSLEDWNNKYNLWRHRFELRTLKDLNDIETNCIVYDNSLKNKSMTNERGWPWASHQPMIKGVMDLYKPEFILELGIGENSTPILLNNAPKYLGVENNKEWIDFMQLKYKFPFVWHDLDRETLPLREYYNSILIPDVTPRLLFVDNYESCRLIAISTLKNKFDLIIFHDCEPEPGARVNHYDLVDYNGFNVYYLKTPQNWTGFMVRIGVDRGFDLLSMYVNKYVDIFKKEHPEMEWMRISNSYEE